MFITVNIQTPEIPSSIQLNLLSVVPVAYFMDHESRVEVIEIEKTKKIVTMNCRVLM